MKFSDWKDYVSEFCELCNYPTEAKEALLDGMHCIVENVTIRECYEKQLCHYEISHERDSIAASVEEIEKQWNNMEVPLDTAKFLFYILCTKQLKRLYDKLGYPQTFFRGVLDDMRAKLMESYRINRIWGTFVGGWYCKFFALERFAIGRLQYNLTQMPPCISLDGRYSFDGDLAVKVHIPSTGPLLKEEVQESMKEAAAFWADSFPGNKTLFMCRSWLLFPGHYEMLPEESGIRQFMEEFEIIHVDIDQEKRNLWRIFGTKDTDDLEKLSRDTTLQRAYAEWLKSGRLIGDGLGIRYI